LTPAYNRNNVIDQKYMWSDIPPYSGASCSTSAVLKFITKYANGLKAEIVCINPGDSFSDQNIVVTKKNMRITFCRMFFMSRIRITKVDMIRPMAVVIATDAKRK